MKQAFGRIDVVDLFRGQSPRHGDLSPSDYAKEKRLTVLVGLDFGTCSTKVAFRIMPDDRVWVLTWGHGIIGYPECGLPSTVASDGGSLLFGAEAERLAGSGKAVTVRSMKRCFLCSLGAAGECSLPQKPCTQRGPARAFAFPSGSGVQWIAAAELVSLYMGHVIDTATEHIRNAIGGRPKITFIYNAAAPVALLRDEDVQTFDRMLLGAYVVSGVTRERGAAASLVEQARDVWRHTKMPPPERKVTWCFGEEDAALSSLAADPGREPGMYCMLDVGAGTTSLSFFFLPPSHDESASYFDSRTLDHGCDDLDGILAERILTRKGGRKPSKRIYSRLLQSIRLAKQAALPPAERERLGMRRGDLERATSTWLERIDQEYWHGWGRGWAKYKRREKWEELRVVLVGGGGALLARRSRAFILERDGYWPMPQSYLRFNLPSYAAPEPGGTEHKTDDGMLMQVAIGLARPGPDIVHFYRPHEVSDYPRAATYEYPTRDALGYGDK